MEAPLIILETIFKENREVPEKRLSDLFDAAGIPGDSCWRTVYRMIFDAKVNLNPRIEKGIARNNLWPVMKMALKNAEKKDFSEKALLVLLNYYNAAYFSVCQSELLEALSELDGLTSEFQSICRKRQGNLEVLQSETIDTVKADFSIEEKIKTIKRKFRETIAYFQSDMVKLDQMSNTDHLTRIYNRRYFDERIVHEAGQAFQEKTWLNLLMIDIDNFKVINDTYGHQVGDQALRTIAKNIRVVCEEASKKAGIGFYPVRYGGEEFAVIMPAVEFRTAEKTAEAIREKISSYSFVIRGIAGEVKHRDIRLTVSIGAACFSHGSDVKAGVAELVSRADKALYSAKKEGRNRVVARCPYR